MNRAIGVIAAINLATTFVLPLSAVVLWLLRRITAPIPAIAEYPVGTPTEGRLLQLYISHAGARRGEVDSLNAVIAKTPSEAGSW
jgi:hypothetical protein